MHKDINSKDKLLKYKKILGEVSFLFYMHKLYKIMYNFFVTMVVEIII